MTHARCVVGAMLCGSFVLCAASPGRHFRGVAPSHVSERSVTAEEIERNLRASFDAVLSGGDDPVAQRLASIEASMFQTYQALPKNAGGRLAPRAVRYIVHNYFAKEHGWIINGLEPDAMQMKASELHELDILEDKAPAFVEGLLEARRSGHGLSLSDVVVMVGALERLIFDEAISLLHSAYTFNDHDVSGQIDENALHEVLTSYLLVFEMGTKGNSSDVRKHQKIKAKMAAGSASWPTIVQFAKEAVTSFSAKRAGQENASGTGRMYSFRDASVVVEDLAQGYGKWQNTECHQMKQHLIKLDQTGTGRVTLDAFYSQSDSAEYQFTESVQYLRQIGALDEPVGGAPAVRIANYISGPSNCIASSTYYSVCCLSECEMLRNDIERKIQAPVASPLVLLGAVGNISSSSIAAPRELPDMLKSKLDSIAIRHDGSIPLHGRLFTQWMHYAFPNECPYPHLIEEGGVSFTPSQWAEQKAMASAEEKHFHVEAAAAKRADHPTQEVVLSQWSDDEVLHLHEQTRHGTGTYQFLGALMRVLGQVSMLGAVLKVALGAWTPKGFAVKKSCSLLPTHAKHV